MIEATKSNKSLRIELNVPPEWAEKELELRVISDRNRIVSKFSDISPRDPEPDWPEKRWAAFSEAERSAIRQREIWYPVVDIEVRDGMEGVAEFANAPGGFYGVNKMNNGESFPLSARNIIPAQRLEYWENVLFVEQSRAAPTSFHIRIRYPRGLRRIEEEIGLLTEDWSGTLALYTADGQLLDEMKAGTDRLRPRSALRSAMSGGESSRETLVAALRTTIDYLLRSRIRNDSSPYRQGLYLFYDHDARTFRQTTWTWTWGPVIGMLVAAADRPEIADIYGRESLLSHATGIGEASLRFQLTDDRDHPAYGLVLNRNDSIPSFAEGYTKFWSPADSLFLAGWGWMPLYRATGDRRFLEASELMVRETGRILKLNDDIIEQDYMVPGDNWKDWILDESGFGMIGIAETHANAPGKQYEEIGRTYIEQILNMLERDDGLWNRMWTRSTRTLSQTTCNTRGMGWAMEGLLSSHKLMPNSGYLDKAARMADRMLSHQQEDGCWTFEFDKPREPLGISEKGTAYWCHLLYRLYDLTRERKYLHAARKALYWCMDHQYLGADPDGHGGIIGCTSHSGVVYRRFYRLSCSYTSAFFGNALIAELMLGHDS